MKVKKLDKKLKENWGLETLVAVGESWLPAMLEQDAVGVGKVWGGGIPSLFGDLLTPHAARLARQQTCQCSSCLSSW